MGSPPRLVPMCRVCLKRPEVPGDPFGRCEACARAGRRVYQFRLRAGASGWAIAAGELSPRALRDRALSGLAGLSTRPAAKGHLNGNTCELVMAGPRVESVRVSPALAAHGDEVVAALRAGASRTDAAW